MDDADNSAVDQSGEMVRSLARGLAVLKSFAQQHTTLSVTEVAARAKLSRATARRLLLTLEHLGYVRCEHGRYSVRAKVLELSYAYLSSMYPWDNALRIMQALSADIDENCLAGVLEDTDVVCVARTARRSVPVSVPVGGRIPAWASSMGRVMLADLPSEEIDRYFSRVELRKFTPQTITDSDALRKELRRVREQGWSLVRNELEPDVIGLAAPVFGADNRVVAAVNISTHGQRTDVKGVLERIRPALLACSKELSLLFGAAPSFD